MPNPTIIKVEAVSKTFKLPHEKNNSIKGAVINFYKRNKSFEKQEVLKRVSFEVKKGEFFGIVGRNGSGKSTLLKMLAGIYSPSEGSIEVNGILTPFIELGVGFNPELTGRENVFLNGALLGFNRNEMFAMYDDIVAFAELEKFMDQKLKNYSSGMQVRLAFSVAIQVNTEILLLDEVLAVGDAAFQRKCYDYFMQLKKEKATVILVTHDMNAIRQYCDRAILIDGGKILDRGSPEKVAQSYQKLFVYEDASTTGPAKKKLKDRWGNQKALANKAKITMTDEVVNLTTEYVIKEDVDTFVGGFTIVGPSGINVVEDNTLRKKKKLGPYRAGEVVRIGWTMPNIFVDGQYTVAVACCDRSTTQFYDWYNQAGNFNVSRNSETSGVVNPTIELHLF